MSTVFFAGVAGVVTGMWLARRTPSVEDSRLMVGGAEPGAQSACGVCTH